METKTKFLIGLVGILVIMTGAIAGVTYYYMPQTPSNTTTTTATTTTSSHTTTTTTTLPPVNNPQDIYDNIDKLSVYDFLDSDNFLRLGTLSTTTYAVDHDKISVNLEMINGLPAGLSNLPASALTITTSISTISSECTGGFNVLVFVISGQATINFGGRILTTSYSTQVELHLQLTVGTLTSVTIMGATWNTALSNGNGGWVLALSVKASGM
jgi:uncharacterized membrane protein